MEALLEKVLEEIEAQDLEYCILRPAGVIRSDERVIEADLLVRRDHLDRFRRAVEELGYVELKSWGHRPHYFFVAFDRDNDRWLKLDVVVDLVCGSPIRFMRVNLTERCLADRVCRRGHYRLSLHHKAVTLVLHCVLDKREFRDNHRRQIRDLVSAAVGCEEVERNFRKCFADVTGGVLSWDEVVAAAHGDAWEELIGRRPVLSRKLFMREPVGNLWRLVKNRFERILRPALHMLSSHGIAIALLAPDGAGKSTVADNLSKERILRTKSIYMGTNIDASTIGLPTTRWINKRIKTLERSTGPKARTLKALRFVNRLCEQWIRCGAGLFHKASGRLVVFDRYGYDGYLAAPDNRVGKRMRRALLSRNCVAPDLVFLLDAPGSVLYERKKEHSPERLENQRRGYLEMREKIPNMTVVDATRPAREVYCDIVDQIWRRYSSVAK